MVFEMKALVKVLREICYGIFFSWVCVYCVLFWVFLSHLLRDWIKGWVFFFRGVLFRRQGF